MSLLAFGVLAAAGAAGAGESKVSELKDDLSTVEAERDELEADLATAEDDVEALAGGLASAKEDARTAEERAREQIEADLAGQQSDLDAQASELAAREAEIAETEQTLQQSTIPDGVWELGRDYEAGTYRAPGGRGCYWEKLSSPSGKFGAIIANGGFNKNQTLTIDSPFFSSDGCGEWVKIG